MSQEYDKIFCTEIERISGHPIYLDISKKVFFKALKKISKKDQKEFFINFVKKFFLSSDTFPSKLLFSSKWRDLPVSFLIELLDFVNRRNIRINFFNSMGVPTTFLDFVPEELKKKLVLSKIFKIKKEDIIDNFDFFFFDSSFNYLPKKIKNSEEIKLLIKVSGSEDEARLKRSQNDELKNPEKYSEDLIVKYNKKFFWFKIFQKKNFFPSKTLEEKLKHTFFTNNFLIFREGREEIFSRSMEQFCKKGNEIFLFIVFFSYIIQCMLYQNWGKKESRSENFKKDLKHARIAIDGILDHISPSNKKKFVDFFNEKFNENYDIPNRHSFERKFRRKDLFSLSPSFISPEEILRILSGIKAKV